MKRSQILLLLFVLLGSVTGYFLYNQKQQPDYSTLTADRNFAPDNIEDIHRIFIAHRDGYIADLKKRGSQWMINEDQVVRKNAIDNVLDAVERIKVKYKPPTNAVPNMVQNLATEGIKVELYDAKDKLLKTYYIGGSTADERGTFAIMEGSEQPYVTHIPGWEGNLRFRFNFKGDDWRDKTLFRYRIQDVQELSIQYPKQRNLSFKMTRKGNEFEVLPFNDASPRKPIPPNQSRVDAFLAGFNEIIAEAFENDNPIQDSILQLLPFSIINIKDQQGNEREVKLFPIVLDGVSIDPKSGLRIMQKEIERYFVEVDNKDFMLAQNRLIKEILWAYDYFF